MTELWSLRETAARLGWPVDRVRRMVKTGRLPAVRINHRYYFKPAEVDAWIEAHAVKPAAKPTLREEAWSKEAGEYADRFL